MRWVRCRRWPCRLMLAGGHLYDICCCRLQHQRSHAHKQTCSQRRPHISMPGWIKMSSTNKHNYLPEANADRDCLDSGIVNHMENIVKWIVFCVGYCELNYVSLVLFREATYSSALLSWERHTLLLRQKKMFWKLIVQQLLVFYDSDFTLFQ